MCLACGIRLFFLASGVFVESIANAGMRDSLGSGSFRESREQSGSTIKSAKKSWKPGGVKVIVVLLARGCSQAKGETHMA